jgi:hypothetical protein
MILPRLAPRQRVFLFGLLLAPITLPAAEDLDSVQRAVTEWARVRNETIRLESDWKSERTILESTLKALNERADALALSREVLDAKTAATRKSVDELQEKSKAAAETLDGIDARLRAASAELLRVRPWLPPRLSDALELPFRSLADDALPVGERVQILVTTFNRCAQFDRTVTLSQEAMTLAGGERRMYEVVYWGLSQGCALDRSAKTAWLGRPGKEGWAWEEHPEINGAVEKLIAIHKDEAEPQFVEVPARVTEPPASASQP